MNFEKNSNKTDIFIGLAASQRYPNSALLSKVERAIHMSNYLQKCVEESNGKFSFIKTKFELIEYRKKRELYLKENRKIDFTSSLFSIEGSHVLDGKLINLDRLYASGVRYSKIFNFHSNFQ